MAKKFALIGAGTMGKNHARTISNSLDCELSVVIDADLNRFLLLSTGSLGSELGIYKIDSFELHGPCNNSGLVQVEVPQGANEWF